MRGWSWRAVLAGLVMSLTSGCGGVVADTCSASPQRSEALTPRPADWVRASAYDERVILLGDPQLHNIHGGSLKRGTTFADWKVDVAIRPPTLNLLAPVVLRHLVENAMKRHGQPDLVVALGDVANIACLPELQDFSQVMASSLGRTSNRVWLSAHGNHDSFLFGIDQTRERVSDSLYPAETMHCAGLPPCLDDLAKPGTCCPARDYSGWTAAEGRCFAMSQRSNSWPQACAGLGRDVDAVTANKLVWMAWYLTHLAQNGVEFEFTLDPSASNEQVQVWRIEGRLSASSTLSARKFEISGRWVSPLVYGRSADRWLSYVVQSFDVSPTRRMILIDTSVDNAFGAHYFTGATANGRLGPVGDREIRHGQREDIKRHIEQAKTRGMQAVLGGHMPLSDLLTQDLELIEEMGVTEYYSAHTHTPTMTRCQRSRLLHELNIGSTTDWPMELVVRDFSAPLTEEARALEVIALGDRKDLDDWGGHALTRHQTLADQCSGEPYSRTWYWNGGLRRHQTCAHQRAARAIVEAITKDVELGKDASSTTCLGSLDRAEHDIARARELIASVPTDSPDERRLLCAARAASQSEGIQK